jgi:hypothetical protein
MKLGGNVRKKALEGASNAAFAAKHKLLDRTSTLNNIRTLAGNDVESSVMDKSRDIYMEGVKSPVLTTFKFSQRAYVDQATGAIIKRPSEITGTVVDTRGNVVLSLSDLLSNKFYYRLNGKPAPFKFLGMDDANRKFKTSKEYVNNKLEIVRGSKTFKDAMERANEIKFKYLLDKPIDIYTRTSANPVLYATKFKEGLYTDANT